MIEPCHLKLEKGLKIATKTGGGTVFWTFLFSSINILKWDTKSSIMRINIQVRIEDKHGEFLIFRKCNSSGMLIGGRYLNIE